MRDAAMNIYAVLAAILFLGVIEILAFVKSRALFRNLSLFILVTGLPLLTGFVGLNVGFVLGAIEQNLAIPGTHFSIVDDMMDGPIPIAIVYSLIALSALTIVLRFVDERRRRKMELPKP
jgi:hypothetical protein